MGDRMFDEERMVMGPFEVDPSGTLFPRDGDAPPCFGFAWRNREIGARLEGGALSLVARVGRVPSSALNVPRLPAFEALRGLRRALPADWRVNIEASHAIRIEIEIKLDGKLTAASLIAALTTQMLALAPYLDLLEESGVAQPN